MKQTRVSRTMADKIANCLELRLVTHQNLGNRRDYWYTYSVVKDIKQDGPVINSIETLLENKSLKETYAFLSNLLDIECKRLHEERIKLKSN